jgi:hypothetical protein
MLMNGCENIREDCFKLNAGFQRNQNGLLFLHLKALQMSEVKAEQI